jgi:hypothetical protein
MMLGEVDYNMISVGDLISWTVLGDKRSKRKGIVLKKWIKTDSSSWDRKIGMLKVADVFDNQIVNIYAINARIQSKSTT